MTGGILALNLVLGRDDKSATVERNYAAVQELVEMFEKQHGSTQCTELLGCNLATVEGQQTYRDENLAERCAGYADNTIEMVKRILQTA